MITKIDIEKFGLFNDYQWAKSIGNDNNNGVFKKINIIYGRNYSGKTTLSRIFRCIETGQIHEKYLDGKFNISDNEGNVITQNNLTYQNKVRVYNKDFIKDNLSWLYDESAGEIKSFSLLGSGNIKAKKRIEEIENELGDIEKKTGLLYQQEQEKISLEKQKQKLREKQNELNNQLITKANQELKLNKYFIKQGVTYDIRNIQAEIDEIISSSKNFILNAEQKELHKKIIDETEKSTINEVFTSKIKLSEYIIIVKSLIEKEITLTNTIQDLLTNSLIQEWVNKGRDYHREQRNTCAFCGGILTEARWKELDAHFSKESEELKEEIQKEIQKLNESKSLLENFLLTKRIVKDNYYSIYNSEFDEIKRQWDNFVIQNNTVISLLNDKLKKRYDDIFNPVYFDNDEKTIIDDVNIENLTNDFVLIIELFNDLSKKNNTKTKALGTDKDTSRKTLRYSEIQTFINTINYRTKLNNNANEETLLQSKKIKLRTLEEKIVELGSEKKQKELELNDEGEAAKKVNSHLSNFFGHNGLELKPEIIDGDKPKTSFIIMRGEEKAHSLSEGECSLISFCYFIAKMEDELNGADGDKLIIYIDDPISSLDNNHIFFMYSLIESVIAKEKRYRQLFISTHNLDFLKCIKRLTIPKNDQNCELVNHFIVEKRKKDRESKCELKIMPKYLKDYVTEYNFLFKEIYNMAKPLEKGNRTKALENDFSHFYNLPNNMRKFLECYLFYRYPNTDEPLKNMTKLFSGHIPSLVNRVVNEYSHLTWGDRGTLVMDIQEAEDVAKEIMRVIKNKDEEHFNALCDSVKVDKNIVL
jgi:wobble nucleotide-excising tRNase